MNGATLAGFTIGVTADRRAEEQMHLLSGRGAECVHGPVIKTHPLESADAIRAATHALFENQPDLVVFTTALGVRGWLEAADSIQIGEQLRDLLADVALVARGSKAMGALHAAGFATAEAPLASYADIAEALSARNVRGLRIAVQLDGGGADDLCDAIRSLGAEVVPVPIYRWALPEDTSAAERLVRATVERRVDALTFTTRPAVHNFLAIADQMGLFNQVAEVLARGEVLSVCVGPVCSSGLGAHGLPEPLVPMRYRLGSMVHEVASFFAARGRDVQLAGSHLRVQGRLVVIDGEREVWMTDRERSILQVLIERPGVVHSKRTLLARVWHGTEHDEHLVEVTMARLRQRLGPAASGIETVVRRGYRVSSE